MRQASYSRPNLACFMLFLFAILRRTSIWTPRILRRSSRTGPRQVLGSTVLGSALAFALPFGVGLAAFAQAPSPQAGQSPAAQTPGPQGPPPPAAPAAATPQAKGADALKARDQDLDAALAHQRESAQSQVKLRNEIEALSNDRRKFNQQLIDTAARIRDVQTNIEATQARLQPPDEKERLFHTH